MNTINKIYIFIILLMPMLGYSQSELGNEYCVRREKVLSMLDSSSALVMKSINLSPYALDYVQEHNFNYLTGIEQPSSIILIAPRGIEIKKTTKRTVIFSSNYKEISSRGFCSQDTVLPYYEFKPIFNRLLKDLKKLYYSAPDMLVINDWINDKPYFPEREMKNKLKSTYPELKIESAESLVGRLRVVKSPHEIELIRKASAITADGIIAAMKFTKPGVFEYEIQAKVEYEYTSNGAMLRGFPSIIGSGINNLILHYSENSRQTQEGDLVVMDVGAKYKGYSSDITRTIPVSGKYSPSQKEIYSIVLQVQKEAIAMLKPGVNMQDVEAFARKAFKKVGYDRYYIHGLSHPVGLDVHDIDLEPVLQAGMVITIEPGLYFPPNDQDLPEEFRGFGIRIEDTVLITETGSEILSTKAPKEIEDIEKLMRKRK